MTSARYSAMRTSLRTAAIMILFTVLFTAVMAFTYETTRPAIERCLESAWLARTLTSVWPG